MNIEKKLYYDNGVTLEKDKLVSIYKQVSTAPTFAWFDGRITDFDSIYVYLDVSRDYYSEVLKIKHDQVIDIKEV